MPGPLVFAANGPLGSHVLGALGELEIPLEYLVLPAAPASAPKIREMAERSGLPAERVLVWSGGDPIPLCRALARKRSDVLLSAGFNYRFPEAVLDLFATPLNLHTSLLPFNRGAYPNVWPLLDGTPAGVTLHRMTLGFDEGPILHQREVRVGPADTAQSLYERLLDAAADLIGERLLDALDSSEPGRSNEGGTRHTEAEFRALRRLDLDRRMSARELIDLLRAMTFPPHRNLYFELDGEKYFVEIRLAKGEV